MIEKIDKFKYENLYKEFNEENLKTASTKTKLQGRLKEYLLAGNTMGAGFGVLFFDGEKVLNR